MDPKLEGVSLENIFLSEKNNGSGYCFCSSNFYHSSLLFQWGMGIRFNSVLFTQGRTVSHLSLVTPVTGPSSNHSTKSDGATHYKPLWEDRWGEVLALFSVYSLFQTNRDVLGNLTASSIVELFPETRIITQRLYILEALNDFLIARKCPSCGVNIFGFILKIIVPEDPHFLSISATGCWLGKPRGY